MYLTASNISINYREKAWIWCTALCAQMDNSTIDIWGSWRWAKNWFNNPHESPSLMRLPGSQLATRTSLSRVPNRVLVVRNQQ